MFSRTAFDSFVAELNLNHFSSGEILTKTDRAHNEPPDQSIWDHIAPTIIVLDKLRAKLGKPISLNSVYRHYEYNRRLRGSALRSQHIAFNAIDFTTGDRTLLDDLAETLLDWRGDWFDAPREFKRTDVIVQGRPVPTRDLEFRTNGGATQFRFRGGVSLYSSFVHIDTRGIDADW